MKNILLVLLILGWSLNTSATCKVIGNLPIFKGEFYRVVNNESAFNEYRGELLGEGIIDNEGKFTSFFKISEPGEALLRIGSNTFYRIWIGQGELTISTINSTLSFTGSLAAQNRFMYGSKFMQPYLTPNPMSFKPNQIGSYLSKLDTLQEQRTLLLMQEQHNGLPVNFVNRMKHEILNSYIYAKSQFPALQSINPKQLPANYYDFWSNFQIQDDDPSQPAYMHALLDFAQYRVNKGDVIETSDKAQMIRKEIIFLDSVLSNRPKTLENIKGDLTLFLIKYFDNRALLQELQDNYTAYYPNSAYSMLIKKKWAERESRLNTRINFTLKDVSGREVNSNKFLGKLVYVDFWGSWCKACLVQMPAAAKLREKFANKEVVFLYIDFYDAKNAWLNTIQAHAIDGINLKAEDADLPYFMKFFGVAQGFPRYAIIDRKGFLKTTSALAPSDKSLVAYLEKELKE